MQGLERAKLSASGVGEAVGLLSGRLGLSSARALAVLRRRSRDTNTPLQDVAAQIVAEAQPDPAGLPQA